MELTQDSSMTPHVQQGTFSLLRTRFWLNKYLLEDLFLAEVVLDFNPTILTLDLEDILLGHDFSDNRISSSFSVSRRLSMDHNLTQDNTKKVFEFFSFRRATSWTWTTRRTVWVFVDIRRTQIMVISTRTAKLKVNGHLQKTVNGPQLNSEQHEGSL